MSEYNRGLPEPDSQGALQRLLVVLAFTIGILIYSYGWTVTEIDLAVPQEEQRQQTLTRALRELLSPRIFDQERTVSTFDAQFLMDCDSGDIPEQSETIIIEPACGSPDDVITIRIEGLAPSTEARLRWLPPEEEGREVNPRPLEIMESGREEFVLNNQGTFTGTIEVPRIRGGDGQLHTVRALVAVPAGPIVFSETANQVIERMVQTIFMALVATSVAIPIAAFISFFAAQNLMRQVRLSVGSMLLAFIGFALGVVLGSRYLTPLGEIGVRIGHGELFAPVGALMAFVIPAIVLIGVFFFLRQMTLQQSDKEKIGDAPNPLISVVRSLVSLLALIFIIGAIGGLGLLGGEQIIRLANNVRPDEVANITSWFSNAIADLIWSVGNILVILGTLVDLFMSAIVGVVTGFAVSNMGTTLFGRAVRSIRGSLSHIVAAIFGAISGATLMTFVSSFGLWATLLGLLPLVVAAILGGQVMLQIGNRLFERGRNKQEFYQRGQTEIWTRRFLFAIGFIAVGYYLFASLNIGRSLVDGTLPAQNEAFFLGMQLPVSSYVFQNALVGAVLGGISGLLAGLQSVFPLGNILYNTSRTTLNIVRSIEPLIMGLVFVIWVGIGPFAGVLALTLHSIAALGKLYSEQIENIDPGPIEALQSTGANQLQTIIYAVVPQIIPPYIAFTMYRWDINVRMSTIIGFVGGGGIGLLLQQQINLLRYRDAGVAVLAIAVVVSILDYASAYIRERLT